jgi:hypothetical protein
LEQEVSTFAAEEIFSAILRDPGLVALYHTAEHLRITDRKTGFVDPEAKAWQEKRNVLGFFDGRPMRILTPQPNGQGVSMPEDYYYYSGFTFLASPSGELFLALEGQIMTFDLAFDGGYLIMPAHSIVPHVTGVWREATRDSRRDNFFGVRNDRLATTRGNFLPSIYSVARVRSATATCCNPIQG